jgi:hypothetical protein
MKNSIKLTGVFVFFSVFLVLCAFRPSVSTAAVNENNPNFNESARGLYQNNCARCHGGDGKSDTELGRLNDAPDISGGRARSMSNAKLTQLITRGRGSMPGFGKKLTRAQIAGLVSYVREL